MRTILVIVAVVLLFVAFLSFVGFVDNYNKVKWTHTYADGPSMFIANEIVRAKAPMYLLVFVAGLGSAFGLLGLRRLIPKPEPKVQEAMYYRALEGEQADLVRRFEQGTARAQLISTGQLIPNLDALMKTLKANPGNVRFIAPEEEATTS